MLVFDTQEHHLLSGRQSRRDGQSSHPARNQSQTRGQAVDNGQYTRPFTLDTFNLVQAQNRLQASTAGTKTIGSTNSSSGSVSLYTVNPEGDINFPVLGKLHIAGMTRYEVGEYIENELITRDLVKDPIVTVEFANTGITVLGEVVNPGRIEFNMDHMTIVDAIAMAGDLKVNGRREGHTRIARRGRRLAKGASCQSY